MPYERPYYTPHRLLHRDVAPCMDAKLAQMPTFGLSRRSSRTRRQPHFEYTALPTREFSIDDFDMFVPGSRDSVQVFSIACRIGCTLYQEFKGGVAALLLCRLYRSCFFTFTLVQITQITYYLQSGLGYDRVALRVEQSRRRWEQKRAGAQAEEERQCAAADLELVHRWF